MSLAQLAAAEPSAWQDVAKALGTLLAGLVGLVGKQLVGEVRKFDGKLDHIVQKFGDHTDKVQGTMSNHELRLDKIEARLPERRKR